MSKQKNNMQFFGLAAYLVVTVAAFYPIYNVLSRSDSTNIIMTLLGNVIVFYGLFVYLYVFGKLRLNFNVSSVLWSMIFAFVQAINKAFANDFSINIYRGHVGLFIVEWLLIGVFAYPLFNSLKALLFSKTVITPENMLESHEETQRQFKYWQFLLVFVGVWGIILAAQYPLAMVYDGLNQLTQFDSIFGWTLEVKALNNHHPVATTFFIGAVYHVGRAIHDTFNFGVFTVGLVEVLINAFGFAFVTYKLIMSQVNRYLAWFIALMMLISPVWLNTNASVGKDALLFTPLIFWTYCYFQFLFKNKRTWQQLLILFALAFVVSIIRPNTFYVMLFTSLALPIMATSWKQAMKFAVLPIVLFVSLETYNGALAKAHVVPAETVEMLSIPLQQAARTVRDHGNELTKHEKQVISEIFPIATAQKYNPQVSDPIKFAYPWLGHNEQFKQKFIKFIPVWIELGMKYPMTYISATYANLFGYFDVMQKDQGLKLLYAHDFQAEITKYFGKDNHYLSNQDIQDKNTLTNAQVGILDSPGIAIYENLGLWSWLIIYGFAMSLWHFKKRKELLMLLLPVALTLGTLMLSPVNGYYRYYLPIWVMLPFVIMGFNLYYQNSNKGSKS
ncbi:MAG: DUF6020 family protein [Lactobacillaceae bacterium]|jgi:hypothetical protein|nr:DUF6020 family protein [Lactobacillaceae bacterium]